MRSLVVKLVGLALSTALIVTAFPARPAAADTVSDEQAFTAALNGVRASVGLPALSVNAHLVDVARAWSGHMAATNVLAHNPHLADQAPSNWQRIGENVGTGGSVDSIHRALVNSPGHYANIVNPNYDSIGMGVVRSGNRIWVTQAFMQTADGYRIVAGTGGVYDFSTAASLGGVPGSSRIVGGASTPSRKGYWAVAENGTVYGRGDAGDFGGLGGHRLSAPIVGMAATPSGGGYWLLGRDGGVFSFGDAAFYGSTGALHLNRPVVGITASPSGRGYWFVASDGGIFAFGDAAFHGSTGAIALNQPIVGMAASPSGAGYWLVARDGGIFAFGDATFLGSTGALRLNQPIVGMSVSATGRGYRFVAADGGIFSFGEASFAGSAGGMNLGQSVVAVLAG